MRTGIGYDVHPLMAGRPLILGGVRIEHAKGLSGHSDADVLAHAIIDALLGAAALGDIGTHFPPGDPRFENASSIDLLRQTAVFLREHGHRVANIDSTVIAQEPRLAAHADTIRASLAQALGIPVDDVSVKSKTADHLGAIGRGEGIAALAIVLLDSP